MRYAIGIVSESLQSHEEFVSSLLGFDGSIGHDKYNNSNLLITGLYKYQDQGVICRYAKRAV